MSTAVKKLWDDAILRMGHELDPGFPGLWPDGYLHHSRRPVREKEPQACSTWQWRPGSQLNSNPSGSVLCLPPQEILQHASARMRPGHANSFICCGMHIITHLSHKVSWGCTGFLWELCTQGPGIPHACGICLEAASSKRDQLACELASVLWVYDAHISLETADFALLEGMIFLPAVYRVISSCTQWKSSCSWNTTPEWPWMPDCCGSVNID